MGLGHPSDIELQDFQHTKASHPRRMRRIAGTCVNLERAIQKAQHGPVTDSYRNFYHHGTIPL